MTIRTLLRSFLLFSASAWLSLPLGTRPAGAEERTAPPPGAAIGPGLLIPLPFGSSRDNIPRRLWLVGDRGSDTLPTGT